MTESATLETATVTHEVTFEMLDEDALIHPSDFHSMDMGRSLSTIKNPETIGQRPRDFSGNRSFWRATSIH